MEDFSLKIPKGFMKIIVGRFKRNFCLVIGTSGRFPITFNLQGLQFLEDFTKLLHVLGLAVIVSEKCKEFTSNFIILVSWRFPTKTYLSWCWIFGRFSRRFTLGHFWKMSNGFLTLLTLIKFGRFLGVYYSLFNYK